MKEHALHRGKQGSVGEQRDPGRHQRSCNLCGAQQVRKQLVGLYTGGGYSLNMINLAKAHTEMYPLLRNSKMWDF